MLILFLKFKLVDQIQIFRFWFLLWTFPNFAPANKYSTVASWFCQQFLLGLCQSTFVLLVPSELTYAKESRSANAFPHKCGSHHTETVLAGILTPPFPPLQPCHNCRVPNKLLFSAMPVRKMHFHVLYKPQSCL